MAYAASTRAESILRGIILGMALAGLLWPTPTSADTVNIVLTDGTLTLKLTNGTSVDSTLTATGPDFSIAAYSGLFGFVGPGCRVMMCSPGSFFSSSTGIFGASGGSVTYAGTSQFITDASVPGMAFASWLAGSASSILMPPLGDPFTVTVPFDITLQIRFADCPTCYPSPSGTFINLTGAGTATFLFAPMAFGPPAWGLTSGVYQIATPEPATWLLAVTAVAGLAWWRKRGRG